MLLIIQKNPGIWVRNPCLSSSSYLGECEILRGSCSCRKTPACLPAYCSCVSVSVSVSVSVLVLVSFLYLCFYCCLRSVFLLLCVQRKHCSRMCNMSCLRVRNCCLSWPLYATHQRPPAAKSSSVERHRSPTRAFTPPLVAQRWSSKHVHTIHKCIFLDIYVCTYLCVCLSVCMKNHMSA